MKTMINKNLEEDLEYESELNIKLKDEAKRFEVDKD
jgi:hypothetical protein